MTASEFINRAVGLPWLRWRSDWHACDCFGLIALWHQEVLAINIGAVPQTDIAAGFSAAQGWIECGPDAGATCFMAWRDGAPTHCGILIDGGRVIHAEGSDSMPGSVRISRLEAVKKIYGDLRYYKFQC